VSSTAPRPPREIRITEAIGEVEKAILESSREIPPFAKRLCHEPRRVYIALAMQNGWI
jgi:hypothetical protein